MIKQLLQGIWKIIDLLCFLGAMGCLVYGFFLLGTIPGVFSIAVVLFVIGYLTEVISNRRQ